MNDDRYERKFISILKLADKNNINKLFERRGWKV